MKKYLNVTKMVILETLQYIPNKLIGLIIYGMFIFIFLQLWSYIYVDGNLIAGYSLNQMIWYVAITEMVWAVIRAKSIKNKLSTDIRSGKIAYTLNKPFNYIYYLLSIDAGGMIVGFFLYLIIGILISYFIIGGLSTFTFTSIPFILITIIFAYLINVFIYIFISLFAFWFEEVTPLFWIYEKFILVVGVLFPIEVFPLFLQPIIKLSPMYTTMYAPAKMVVDFSLSEFFNIFLYQVGYLIVFVLLSFTIYNKGVKKLSVNGG